MLIPQTFPEWRGYSKGILQILVGQKYDHLQEVPFLCGHTSLKIVKRILKNSVTIMTYLKILKKMPDQYCIRFRCSVEKHLNFIANCMHLMNWQVPERERRRDHRHLVKRKSTREIILEE